MADRALLRRSLLIALAVAVLLSFAGVFQHELWTPDEPREAEVGREMLTSNFSAMPTLGGEPFLEKPPLYAWITAASYSVFGVSASAARVPSTLFSIGAILVAYLLGERAAGRAAGLCSAIVLATMWQFSETSHKAVLDIGLTFFVAAGHLAFLRCQAPNDGFQQSRLAATGAGMWRTVGGCQAPYVAIGVCSGLAFLTKAWIGPALLCAPPILAAAAMRDWEYVKRVLPRAFVAAVLGVAILGGPWVMALAATPGGGWGAVKECLWTEYVGRSVGGDEFTKRGHAKWPLYYTYTALLVVAPWCLALPAMLRSGSLSRTWRGGRALWCALTFVAGVILLSVPSGKRDLYLVPLMPVAAVAVGVWLSRVGSTRGGAWDRGFCVAVTVLFVSGIVSVGAMHYAIVHPDVVRGLIDLAPKADLSAEVGGSRVWVASAFVAAGVALLAVAAATRRRRPVRARSSWLLAVAGVAALLAIHGGLRPVIDPLRDMAAGSREIAALVPADERLLGFSADETTVAIVPFFSGRILENVEDPAEALKALDSGGTRHLVVMDKSVRKLTPALKKRLDLAKTVRVSATRDVNVYVLKP